VDVEEKKLHIKLAYGYYQNKEYKKAVDLYEKIYKADTEDFNVLNMLSDTYFRAGMKDKALEAYVDTLTILERKDLKDKLLKLIKKITKNFPDDSRVKTKLKNVLREMMREAEKKASNHEYGDARAIYESIQEFNSDDTPVNIKIKELNDDEANYVNRTRRVEESKKTAPQDTQRDLIAKFDKMAQNYINNGDYDGAVETYITALKLAPGNEELRTKLHAVYVRIASEQIGEKVWQKLDKSPVSKLEEAKKKALEERHAQIMKEEEDRARTMLDEEAKIQQEYEQQEMAIIQAAAVELKAKLEEAQKSEQLKEEEVQRIMKEQEEKKKELLEKLKREAIDKFKKQKDAIVAQAMAAQQAAQAIKQAEAEAEAAKLALQEQPKAEPRSAPQQETRQEEPAGNNFFEPRAASKANLMDTLKKAYETPKVGGQEPGADEMKQMMDEKSKDIKVAPSAPPEPKPEQKSEPKQDEILDDIGEAEKTHAKEEALVVNDDTLDSLITMSYIYINQAAYKDAMKIYNALAEKYPNNSEVKNIATEISKKQGN
jgi:tetratricopeptide (TPR) repeat protein